MKRELDTNRDALSERIRQEYGLVIQRLTPIIKGMVSYHYTAGCAGGARYFLKLYNASRLGRVSAARLGFTLPLTWNLHHKGLLLNVPYPIRTRCGDLETSFNGLPLILFNFIEGRTLAEEPRWSDDTLATLGRAAAFIHKSTPLLDLEIPYVEHFDFPFIDDLLKGYDALEQVTTHDGWGKQALRELLLPRKGEMLRLLQRLGELQQLARARPREMVLCHTDLTPENLMVDEQGKLYILDWEGAMLAPPEHDLFFFTGDRFEIALASYVQERGHVQLDPDLFSFYFHRRNLEDLTDWIVRILYENQDDDQDGRDLEGIREDCLDSWPCLDAGAKLREVIAAYVGQNS